jgi:uncharacterized Tic20 family protein
MEQDNQDYKSCEKQEIREEKTNKILLTFKYLFLFGYILGFLYINLFYLQTSQNFGGPLSVLVMELLALIALSRILKIDDFLSVIFEVIKAYNNNK